MRITGATRLAGVIGDPIEHSRSPLLHNAAFAACDLDWVYTAFRVPEEEVRDALRAMRTLDIGGLSVTMPDKGEAARCADSTSGVVDALGVANCLVNRDGVIHADNTDGEGFTSGLREDAGVTPEDAHVVIVGAGGAARAVAHACAKAGAGRVSIVNRSRARAELCASLAGTVGVVADEASIGDGDIVVNATPVGMLGDGALPFRPELLSPDAVVVDLVYEPARTPLIEALLERDLRAFNGLSMLVHQAAVQFTLWTGRAAPVDAMRASLS